jgi:AAHS family benzoate transporter-like MFS transporter
MIGSIGGGILSDKFHLKPVIMGMLLAITCCQHEFW